MTGVLVPVGGLLAAILGLAFYWYRAAQREFVVQRLRASEEDVEREYQTEAVFASRHRLIPWLVVIPLGVLVAWWGSWPVNITCGIVLVVGSIGMEIDAWIYQWRLSRIEAQLADAIDVVVSSVSAGASLQAALQQASEYSPMPLRAELAEMVARLRFGDSPVDVFVLLEQRVPTETFQLLSTTLNVNWQVGGELAGTLAAIAGTIRDRLAIARQLRTLSTQGTLTTLTVLVVVWFMAAMMWQSDPPRFVSFLLSEVGSWLIAVGLLMQGIGVALVSRISRPKI